MNRYNRMRVVVAIPVYNEAPTIADVITRVQKALPNFDLLIVNDGSGDATGAILRQYSVRTVTHNINQGYHAAMRTAMRFAWEQDYDVLITLDADGQHIPEQVGEMYRVFQESAWDYLIGSRYVHTQDYDSASFPRRLGMQLFSHLTSLLTGTRIFDTTSGLRMMHRVVLQPLLTGNFLDYHAEAIIYLLRRHYSVGEYPITVSKRAHGQSMYSLVSAITYPVRTLTLSLLAAAERTTPR